ncbi:MAG: agmatine deiminase family protein [Lachnospiraceae bacterium]|nr:agmatine deiminase family protein [Lachnospiraceae bacterium]
MKTSKTDFHNLFQNLRLHLQENALYMPPEYTKHEGTILIWPTRPGSWIYDGRDAKPTFCEMIYWLLQDEDVHLIVDAAHITEAEDMIFSYKEGIIPKLQDGIVTDPVTGEEKWEAVRSKKRGELSYHVFSTDDSWARDTGPIIVYDKKNGCRVGLDFGFNAWGGSYNGLYEDYANDAEVAVKICKDLGIKTLDLRDFILEGGSIHTDGEGTLLTTGTCLLSPGRNPDLSKEEIEELLCIALGAKKVWWLPAGMFGDETDEHVDNMCAFLKPGTVALAWCEDESDPQYENCRKSYEYLQSAVDAQGRKPEIVLLPIPKEPVCITEEELAGFVFAPGEDEREVGERLSASYVNFYIANNKILFPQFGDENDEVALEIMREKMSDYEVCPIYTKSLLLGGGNIHCLTQQIPVAPEK